MNKSNIINKLKNLTFCRQEKVVNVLIYDFFV